MTHEQMAGFMVDEFVEDIDRLYAILVQFEDRWMKYSKQWEPYLTDEKRAKLHAALDKFHVRFPED